MKNPDLILTSDWHLRSTIPTCRKGGFFKEQEDKVNFILKESHLYQCPIVIAGDIGNIPQWENWLLEQYIEKFKKHNQRIYVLPGQHDLPNHRLDRLHKSGLGVLIASNVVILLLREPSFISVIDIEVYPVQFGNKIPNVKSNESNVCKRYIAVIHQLVSQSKLWEGQKNFTSAKSLLKKFSCYDLIISGDNHQSFVEEYKGRLLVNPGSIMRTTISQKDFKPKIYLWYAETNTVKEVFIPIKEDVFNPIEEIIELDDENTIRFIQTIKRDYDINISFEKNMERCLNKNSDLPERVKNRIYEAMNVNEK